MMNTAELNRRCDRVLGAIDKLSVADALAVMSEAIRKHAEQEAASTSSAANDAKMSSVELHVAGSGWTKIECDLEIRDFIHGLQGRLSFNEMAEECRRQFGDRAPGKSSIHRYIQKLKCRRDTGGKGHE